MRKSQLRPVDLVLIYKNSLNPSFDPNGFDLATTLQALLVVAPSGQIQFATPRARLWLNDFVPTASTPDRLPETLTRWLADGISGGQPLRFTLDRPETRLCVQMLCWDENSIGLLLERNPHLIPFNDACIALTDRQIEVLAWVARGKTNAEIGEISSLKTGTIGKYLERIFPKLGVENRTAAASFVLGTNMAG
ncbi:MAG: helix-turn-helix transcriptional regulator [Verrucomicrobiota bacterium]|nr:helix-turn-helix transcriptional regulator [Verrucomicrobiota bacterium]